jgi:asparagine synthase (glutamine-hydrolysing)
MCGIAGIFGEPNTAAVGAMLEAMLHRGPDDGGVYADDLVAIGQRRLAIVDTSPAGHQPMPAAGGEIQLVFNGEIYNFREERAALERRGRRFSSQSDTEVILALYEAYGEAFVSRLRGIFALGLYDRRAGRGREKLILARDHFGIKPLLYAEPNGAFVFASELKAMLASGMVEPEIDPAAVRQLLNLGSVYQPRTIIAGVKALPSAHMIIVTRAGRRIERYWSYGLDRINGLRRRSYEEQLEALHAVIRESIRLQMMADVPVGAFLSGGVDSSLVVAMMSRATGAHVKTFSVGFEAGANATDESHEAAEMAAVLETEHSRVLITAADMETHLARFVRGIDQPSVDGLNSYFVSYAAAQAVTVSLSGTGGDEVFLGYPWFGYIGRDFPVVRQPRRNLLERSAGILTGRRPLMPSTDEGIGLAIRDVFGRLYHCFGPDSAHQTLSAHTRAATAYRSFAEEFAANDELPDSEPLERTSVLCLNGYTRNQLLRDIDCCAMTHSLEVRVPFLDPVVVDHALSLPSESKLLIGPRTLEYGASYTDAGVKRVVCDVAKSYLPPWFFERRSKKGFALPYGDWLRGPLFEIMSDALSPRSVAEAGLFDPQAVSTIRCEFLEDRRPWSHVWLLMIIELWRRDVLLPAATTRAEARPPDASEAVAVAQ